jgi:hypothetical protein
MTTSVKKPAQATKLTKAAEDDSDNELRLANYFHGVLELVEFVIKASDTLCAGREGVIVPTCLNAWRGQYVQTELTARGPRTSLHVMRAHTSPIAKDLPISVLRLRANSPVTGNRKYDRGVGIFMANATGGYKFKQRPFAYVADDQIALSPNDVQTLFRIVSETVSPYLPKKNS